MTKKNAPATDQSNQDNCTTAHPAWLRVQRIVQDAGGPDQVLHSIYSGTTTIRRRHPYSETMPGGALLKALMVYLIKSPDGRACRATSIKTIGKNTGFTPSDVRGVLDFLIRHKIIQQIATAEGAIQLHLAGEVDYEVY